MTTWTFTAEARKEATRDGVPPIEPVDGKKMIAMFSEFELGLKPIKTFEIDNDWQSQKLCPPETDKTANDFWQTRR